ncbi:hypothetical protein BGX24_000530, partial [Mortierella sp. AD032]
MALLPDPPTPTMSQGGASNSSQASLMTPYSTPSRAPQNITDHPDMFPSPDNSARSPQVAGENSQYIAPPATIPFASRIDLTPPPLPPGDPQNWSPALSSLTNPHTQPINQGQEATWDSSTYVAPHQSYNSSSSASHPSSAATVAPHQNFSEPNLVDNTNEKIDSEPPKQTTSNGKRKRLYWIGGILIVILLGVVIGLVVNMNKDNGSKNNSNNNNSSAGSVPTPSRTTGSGKFPTGVPVGGTPSSSSGAVIAPTGVPVTVPTTPTTPGQSPLPPPYATTTTSKATDPPITTSTSEPPKPTSGGGEGGDRIPTPPLPDNMPPKGQCPMLWCDTNYLWPCDRTCMNDGDLKRCKAGCKDEFCQMACEEANAC